jgi:transcriptional regulator with XRE-family HTH domain
MNQLAFASTLKTFRQRARVSQAALGRRCDFDHSYISRLESSNRYPSREAVERISAALSLSKADDAVLMHAAGFLSATERSPMSPLAVEVHSLLSDEQTPLPYRMMVAQVIGSLVSGSRGSV